MGRPRRIVLCYATEPRHLAQIQQTAPGDQIIDAGQERIADEILQADIFFGHAKVPVPWPDVVRQGRLRWIQSSAAGMDHCLVPDVIGSEIPVSSASGLFANQVAEQTLALLLALVRNLPVFFRAQHRKEFIRRPTGDLHGKTVGIVGFGGNGRRIADVLAPWKTRIVATDMFPVACPDHVDSLWPADQLPRLLAESDIVILCVPLNEQTDGWFDQPQIERMKTGSLLINVARGPVVVEQALADALDQGQLAGAGLDVTEVEPLAPESRLWDQPNVVITPHVGAQAADRNDVATDFFCSNLRRFDRGEVPMNLVDKQLGFPLPQHHQLIQQLVNNQLGGRSL